MSGIFSLIKFREIINNVSIIFRNYNSGYGCYRIHSQHHLYPVYSVALHRKTLQISSLYHAHCIPLCTALTTVNSYFVFLPDRNCEVFINLIFLNFFLGSKHSNNLTQHFTGLQKEMLQWLKIPKILVVYQTSLQQNLILD